jgi:hypothetical protein
MLKTVSSVANALGALNYKGTWNADTNTPTLASGVGTQGDYYVVSVAGATDLDGITNWGVGDWAAFNGSVWQRVEGGADGNFVNLTVTGTGKIDDLIVGATSAPQAGVNLEVKSATSELRLSTSDGSITNGETIGKITWNAPDEGSGPNAIIVAGEISLVSDGNWDSTRYTPSNIVFKTTPVNGPTMVEAARFTSTGNLAFPSGQGIDFSATAGTGTSELFDDYEEGVWTPTLVRPSAGGFTYTPAAGDAGYYTKVGNICYVSATLGGTFSGGSGYYQINGLPFNNAGNGTALSVGNLANLSAGAAIGITVANVNTTSTIINGTPVSGNVHSFSAVYAV